MTQADHFYGLQPRWFGPDRLFKLFLRNGLLCGARVAGQIYDEQVAGLLPQLDTFARRALADRALAEAAYDRVDSVSPEFLARDSDNFQLRAVDVVEVVLRSTKNWWTGPLPNVGTLTLGDRIGRKRRFILVGKQEPARIAEALRQHGFAVCFA